MSDSISITFELNLKPEVAAGFIGFGQGILQETRKYKGFRNVRIVQHKQDPNRLLFIERWENENAYNAYIAARTATGELAGMQSLALKTETNFWPNLIAESIKDVTAAAANDGVSITFSLMLHPAAVTPFIDAARAPEFFTGIAAFDGFRSIRMVQHRDDPTRILFIQRWDSESAYLAYYDWRDARGEIEGMRQISSRLDIDVWPALIANAFPPQ